MDISLAPSDESDSCGFYGSGRLQRLFEILQTVTDPALLISNSTPQGKALRWIVQSDSAQLCPDQEYECPNRLIQRYTLATTYFATNGDNWRKCSASDNNCGNEVPFDNGEFSFLNVTHECSWAGITCHDSMCIQSINFGKQQFIMNCNYR